MQTPTPQPSAMNAVSEPDPLPPITLLLHQATQGDRDALDQVFESLYPDLRRVARARLHQQGRPESLNSSATPPSIRVVAMAFAETRAIPRPLGLKRTGSPMKIPWVLPVAVTR